jgi:hypothetical protein
VIRHAFIAGGPPRIAALSSFMSLAEVHSSGSTDAGAAVAGRSLPELLQLAGVPGMAGHL